MTKPSYDKETNTGSGTQTPPPRPQDKVAGNTVAHRADTDSGKNSRLDGAASTRPSKAAVENSGMADKSRP